MGILRNTPYSKDSDQNNKHNPENIQPYNSYLHCSCCSIPLISCLSVSKICPGLKSIMWNDSYHKISTIIHFSLLTASQFSSHLVPTSMSLQSSLWPSSADKNGAKRKSFFIFDFEIIIFWSYIRLWEKPFDSLGVFTNTSVLNALFMDSQSQERLITKIR